MISRIKEYFNKNIQNNDSLYKSRTQRVRTDNNRGFIVDKAGYEELFAMSTTAIGNKILNLKVNTSLNNAINFKDANEKDFYNLKLDRVIREAVRGMLIYGRAVILIKEPNANLLTELPNNANFDLYVFAGQEVNVSNIERDLNNSNYGKPVNYQLKGFIVHPSRIIDFSYITPITLENKATFNYGGISEFQILKESIKNDAIIQEVVPLLAKKGTNLFYKIKELRERLQSDASGSLIKSFEDAEDCRGILGATVLDAGDDVLSIQQTLANLNDIDNITLRRISLGSGIPMAVLVGENVQGLNSSGAIEMTSFNMMIENLRKEFVEYRINNLLVKLGKEPVNFIVNDGTPLEKIQYEQIAIANSKILFDEGEDYSKYLEEKGVIKPDDVDFWSSDE